MIGRASRTRVRRHHRHGSPMRDAAKLRGRETQGAGMLVARA